MASVPRVIPGVVDVHFRWISPQGQMCENVYQFKYSATPSGATCAALAQVIGNALLPKYQAFMADTIAFTEVFVKDIGAASGRGEGTYIFPGVTTGMRGEDPDPSHTAASIVLRTGLTGKSNHGRKSIGGFTEPWISKDEFSNQLILWLVNLALQWLVTRTANGINFTPAVASDKYDTSYQITGTLLPDQYVDSQKTRLIKHGR